MMWRGHRVNVAPAATAVAADRPRTAPPGRVRWHDAAVPSVPPAIDLLPRPDAGRVFVLRGRVRLGDVDRNGRMRLDATARFMQDAATDDASDAGLDRAFGWLVRRTLIDTTRPATIGEPIAVSTWCTGIGRSWAERRTQIVGERGALIDAVSLWVQVDVEHGRPARIAADFVDAYATAAAGRTVSARLALPGPVATAERAGEWPIRRTDLDPFGHVNNAATWSFLEEVAGLDASDRVGRSELEYLRPVERDGAAPPTMLCTSSFRDGATAAQLTAWMIAADTPVAAARWSPAGC